MKFRVEGFDASIKTVLSIFDNSGKVVLNREIYSSQAEIDLSQFASGIYQLNILQNNKKAGFQIIKQ